MWIAASDEHTVFLHKTEARRSLACAGEGMRVAGFAHEGKKAGGSCQEVSEARRMNRISERQGSVLGGDSRAAGECVQGNSFAKEDFADGTADCGAVVDGTERRAL